MVLQYKLLSEALFGVNPENIVIVVSHLPKIKVRLRSALHSAARPARMHQSALGPKACAEVHPWVPALADV